MILRWMSNSITFVWCQFQLAATSSGRYSKLDMQNARKLNCSRQKKKLQFSVSRRMVQWAWRNEAIFLFETFLFSLNETKTIDFRFFIIWNLIWYERKTFQIVSTMFFRWANLNFVSGMEMGRKVSMQLIAVQVSLRYQKMCLCLRLFGNN